MFLFLFSMLMKSTFASSCKGHFQLSPEIQDDLQLSTFQTHLQPHAHKLKESGKYCGKTGDDFKSEGSQKQEEFRSFFKQYYPRVQGQEIEMNFWSSLAIRNEADLNEAFRIAQKLEMQDFPLNGFIFIIYPDQSMRIAPRTILNGVDTGAAKHIALSLGAVVVASGELSVLRNELYQKIIFNLKSGTYMKALVLKDQFQVCRKIEKYFLDMSQKYLAEFTETF